MIHWFRHFNAAATRTGRAFTLIEMMLSLAIISILATLGALAFRQVASGQVTVKARDALVAYARIARGYAISNQIETMLVINPFNGRFELWHAHPPIQGGSWDPQSETSPDGYAFAPVLDSTARLPVSADGSPAVAVCPIDYDDPTYRPVAADAEERNIDNLTWTALCFDATGQLTIQARRIATRTYTRRDGSARPQAERNRLADETPDTTLLINNPPMVMGGAQGDTPITSCRGVVVSDSGRMRAVLSGIPRDPTLLVNDWLLQTRPGGRYAAFAETVVFNQAGGLQPVEIP